MGTMIVVLLVLANVLVIAWGAYFRSYLKRKGENLATKEDFKELKRQTAELTQTTKEIETKIEDQAWNRQRQWELKRDALIEGSRAASDLMSAVMKVNAAFAIEEKKDDLAFGTQLANHQTEAMQFLNKASYDFQRTIVLVSVVSGLETQTAFVAMEKILKTTASKIVDGDTEVFKKTMPLVKKAATAITNVIRKELNLPKLDVDAEVSWPPVP
ncbi:MAG TPA: hypothetical protein VG844_18020 [Terracidiphilus sp.]|nr:hypothetical protein [Terracidiphilus sp.]